MSATKPKMRRITILIDEAFYGELAEVKIRTGKKLSQLTRMGLKKVVREQRDKDAAALTVCSANASVRLAREPGHVD